MPFLPGGGGLPPPGPDTALSKGPGTGGLQPKSPAASGFLKPGSKPPGGKPGQKAGTPNFKSRITKPGGMKAGGKVTVKKVKAGQGSGIGRLLRSK
jgi:hypothetical protein